MIEEEPRRKCQVCRVSPTVFGRKTLLHIDTCKIPNLKPALYTYLSGSSRECDAACAAYHLNYLPERNSNDEKKNRRNIIPCLRVRHIWIYKRSGKEARVFVHFGFWL